MRRLLLVLLVLWAAPATSDDGAGEAQPVRRVVSLSPSQTGTLVALGATDVLVGVDDYSARVHPEVADLPTVGGLFDPGLEAIVALEPDLVVLVPNAHQRDLETRLRDLGIDVFARPNITLDELVGSIQNLGARVGRAGAARERVEQIRRAFREVEGAASQQPPVRAVLVLQRDPLYLVGSGSFLDAMLRAAGAENLGASFDAAYPRAGVEWLIAAAPDVILDSTDSPPAAAAYWSRWPSLPAVRSGRVRGISADWIRPGPHVDRSLREIAKALRE